MSAVAFQETPRSASSHVTTIASQAARPAAATSPRSIWWKTLLDCGSALVLLIPGLPIIGILVALVRLTSRGPGIYAQLRVGKEGQTFLMYKLRSMRIDAEAGTGPVWSAAGRDPRVTVLGSWLRRLHLDELPQLFNVLRGEMSLVGPRPERPEFVKVLAKEIPGYLDRLAVLPGITGLAQVNFPPDTDLDSVRRKVALDCEYISTAGLQLDLRIILCTILRVFGLRGGRSVRLLGLQRTVRLSANAAPIGGQPDAPPVTPETIVIYKAGGATITYDDIRSFSQEGDDRPESSTPAASTSPSLSKI